MITHTVINFRSGMEIIFWSYRVLDMQMFVKNALKYLFQATRRQKQKIAPKKGRKGTKERK